MSSAESILYDNMSEVHPGAGSVRQCLAEHGNSRYLYEMYTRVYGYASRVEPRYNRLYF